MDDSESKDAVWTEAGYLDKVWDKATQTRGGWMERGRWMKQEQCENREQRELDTDAKMMTGRS